MKIAQLAPLWKEIPPKKYGGSELVVSLLTEQLVKMGHDVTLYACGGSRTKAKLKKIIDKTLFDFYGRFNFEMINPFDILALKTVFDDAAAGKIDIIHNHIGFHSAMFEQYSPVPMVTTNHNGYKPDFAHLNPKAKKSSYISISYGQRKNTPGFNYIANVYHGIDTKAYKYKLTPGKYLLFLATMWKDKGVDRAITIAKKAKMKLVMAGNVRSENKDFEEIKSQIDGDQIVFVGEVNMAEKQELFSNAYAYLFPIRCNEAFGLTVAESLACGTPVVAWPNGSMPEIIEHSKNGFLVSSIDEAVKILKKIPKIDRSYCRKCATKRFDASIMAKNYLKIYEEVLNPAPVPVEELSPVYAD